MYEYHTVMEMNVHTQLSLYDINQIDALYHTIEFIFYPLVFNYNPNFIKIKYIFILPK